MSKTELAKLEAELTAAIYRAMTREDAGSLQAKWLKVSVYTTSAGVTEIVWTEVSDKTLGRVKKFAGIWLQRHYPALKLLHVARRGYRLFATYFSGGQFDCHAVGLCWRNVETPA